MELNWLLFDNPFCRAILNIQRSENDLLCSILCWILKYQFWTNSYYLSYWRLSNHLPAIHIHRPTTSDLQFLYQTSSVIAWLFCFLFNCLCRTSLNGWSAFRMDGMSLSCHWLQLRLRLILDHVRIGFTLTHHFWFQQFPSLATAYSLEQRMTPYFLPKMNSTIGSAIYESNWSLLQVDSPLKWLKKKWKWAHWCRIRTFSIDIDSVDWKLFIIWTPVHFGEFSNLFIWWWGWVEIRTSELITVT